MKRKIFVILIVVYLLVTLVLPPLFITLWESGTKIRWNVTADHYQDYYIYRIDYSNHGIFESTAYTRLWFKPSQKEQLLNRIKEDVNDILTDVQTKAANEAVTIVYEISDDFKDVTIYVDKYAAFMRYDNGGGEELKLEVGKRVVLYHELLYSINNTGDPYDYGNSIIPYYGTVIKCVYTGTDADREAYFEEQKKAQTTINWPPFYGNGN